MVAVTSYSNPSIVLKNIAVLMSVMILHKVRHAKRGGGLFLCKNKFHGFKLIGSQLVIVMQN